ncbi:MAG: tetratricopeptide repeat protein [Polyangiaceae bacterium]
MRFSVFAAVVVILVAARAEAQSAAPDNTPRSDRVLGDALAESSSVGAHEHFERALTWYRAGKYRRAVEELNAALDRDPGGKDLVFNLALVQEKLGDLEGAIRSLGRFQSLEKDPVELERAAQAIERLRGAQSELAANRPQSTQLSPPAPVPLPRPRGKLDAWVIGTGGVAIAAFVVGTVFGVRALTLDSRSEDGRARDAAMIADFAFATSVLTGAGSLGLYFGRYADATPERVALPLALPGMPRVSGGGFVLRY